LTAALRAIALPGIPVIGPGDDLAGEIRAAAARADVALRDGFLVIAQKVVSKQEGRIVALADIEPSEEAVRLAREGDKDARHMEVVLRESRRIVRTGHAVIITETHHGFVCANSGVDLSNAPGEDVAVLLPEDPDASARRLRRELGGDADTPLGVVVSDTFGRPWREGLVDLAIGSAGFAPLVDYRGRADLAGRELVVTTAARADQLAALAGILMEKDAATPAVWIDGIAVEGEGSLRDLLRDPSTDLFR
jgi:coenzyme F420-0:L-glutamate ligase/coenzyme F420-1:gamma-L-glutamate ligase